MSQYDSYYSAPTPQSVTIKKNGLPFKNYDSLCPKEKIIEILPPIKIKSSISTSQSNSAPVTHRRRFGLRANPDHSAVVSIRREVFEKSSLTQDDIKAILYFFKKYNPHKTVDGLLNKKQFSEYGESLGISDFLQEQLFRIFDLDQDGLLDFREFTIGLSIFMGGTYNEKLKCLFYVYSFTNCLKANALHIEDTKRILRVVYSDDKEVNEDRITFMVQSIHKTMDVDRDGVITFKEFRTCFNRNPYLIHTFNFIFSPPFN
ncbi:neurocalcin-delta [Acrasis kona]|uniref:Neurocalcin-delta n=1 Tax=Acrasis kona TaxID=1008807 RepID=A0AAW2ZHR2_9EUKA